MFTGIIHHTGIFRGYKRARREIAVEAPPGFPVVNIGESVAVNGTCLSLIKKEKKTLFFNISEETLERTTLGKLKRGQKLNLELPLTLSSLTSGHLLTGHVDSKGKITKIIRAGAGKRLTISFPSRLRSYLIPKGSVAIDGVSLTVASLGPSFLETELIPITLEKSNLSQLRAGDEVNIECDIIGKYVYNWISKEK
ncbi:MAG: riboflavin synthase [Candidatus Aminicenantales bacterium]